MTTCQCPHPIRGPGTLTDYTAGATIYDLCATCGLPIPMSGRPEREYAHQTRQATKDTVRHE